MHNSMQMHPVGIATQLATVRWNAENRAGDVKARTALLIVEPFQGLETPCSGEIQGSKNGLVYYCSMHGFSLVISLLRLYGLGLGCIK